MCTPIVQEWAKSTVLVSRAGAGRLALSPNKHVCREDLITNEEVLVPVLRHLGTRVTIDTLVEHIDLFFTWARPKGKPAVRSDWPQTFAEHSALFTYDSCSLWSFLSTGSYFLISSLGEAVRTQAWIVRRLVSVFARMAKRGHFPREKAIQRIYVESGIALPVDPRYLFQTDFVESVKCHGYQLLCAPCRTFASKVRLEATVSLIKRAKKAAMW